MFKFIRKIILSFVLLVMILINSNYANASAWWGEGARSSEWVTSHGGTIIYFEFKGVKSGAKDLKINLYTSNGDVIETERGDRKGKIDDGIAGQPYYLKAKDGGKSAKSSVFSMKRGSTNYATVDIKSGKISLSLGGGTVAPKKVITTNPVAQKAEPEKELPVAPVLGKKELDYRFLVQPVVNQSKEKLAVKKERVRKNIDPRFLGKTSKKKIDYNLAYNYYKVDYKRIRDGKFELKLFTLRKEDSSNLRKVAKSK